jgi:hypothetical protein
MLFVLVPSLWLTVLTAVLAACRMAARADAHANPPAEAQSPRRPTTCGTVRRRIFTSVHSDQFATYR